MMVMVTMMRIIVRVMQNLHLVILQITLSRFNESNEALLWEEKTLGFSRFM